MSDYFDASLNRVVDGTRATAADVNSLKDATGAGFDKLPTSEDLKRAMASYGVDTGAADAYVVAMTNTRIAYEEGMEIVFNPTNDSTGPSTIDVDTIGAKNIKQPDGNEISAGVIQAGGIICLRYNGTFFVVTGGGLYDSTAAAAASAAAAAASAANASTSETNSAASAAAALVSENAGAVSAAAALVSENAAAASAAAALVSENAAAASAAAAAVIETDLASNDAGKGSGLVGRESGAGTVTAALDAIEANNWVTQARIADNSVGTDELAHDVNILVNYMRLNTSPIIGGALEGDVYWNNVSKTMNIVLEGGVVMQVGQELPIYVKNTSGSTVDDGKMVYVAGTTGINLIVGLADASDLTKCSQVGMVTTSGGIANNGFGFVTRFGAVRDVDTDAFTEGSVVYLSATTPGDIIAAPPGTPHYTVEVGIVVNKSATVGIFGVDPKQPIAADVALGTSDKVAPTQGAVKTYVDSAFKGGALVYHSIDQSVADNDITVDLDFDSEAYDTDSIHDTVTNNSRLTVPAGVTKVKLKAQVQIAADATGVRSITINKNGSIGYIGAAKNVKDAASSPSVTVMQTKTPVLAVTAGDYFESSPYQNSGGALNAITGSTAGSLTWFAMEIIERG